MSLDKNKIYQNENGRVYFSKRDQSWFYVDEGCFLTAAANSHYSSDRAACESARPQRALSEQEAQQLISE